MKVKVTLFKAGTVFTDTVIAVDYQDAILLLSIKEGKVPFNGITKKLVQEALPDATQGW